MRKARLTLKKKKKVSAFGEMIRNSRIAKPGWGEITALQGYRLLISALALVLTFGAFDREWVRFENLDLARGLALVYFCASVVLALHVVNNSMLRQLQILVGLLVDVVALSLAIMLTRGLENTIPLLLLVSLGVTTHYLPMRLAMGFGALAVIGLLAALLVREFTQGLTQASVNAAMVGVFCFGVAAVSAMLGERARNAEALAARRRMELLDMDRLNDLVVHRMRTGVLVLDENGRVQRMNESARRQLGGPQRGELPIEAISPVLDEMWRTWRKNGTQPQSPTSMAAQTVPSLPRFIRLFADRDDLSVVFLEDIVLLNQHAEALTLDSLGRLSASIAHELRNPLGAIRQAGQLLGEASDLPERHQKLIGIIDKHSQRLEHIVRGVLDLAKREMAKPDVITMNQWLTAQVEEFRLTRLPEGDDIVLLLPPNESEILFDPVHLDQVVGNLMGNALNYGRPAQGPLVITVTLTNVVNQPLVLRIADNGAGIPEDKVELAFKPFYTTGKGGTGLGLYLCRQLCESNSATLDYEPVAEGGASFVTRFHRPVIFGDG